LKRAESSEQNRLDESVEAKAESILDQIVADAIRVSDPVQSSVLALSILQNPEFLQKLLSLVKCVHEDPITGDLVLRNGKVRCVLKQNGTIRLEGLKIVQVAEQEIALNAAYIDLN
jgi:hypothetical protein